MAHGNQSKTTAHFVKSYQAIKNYNKLSLVQRTGLKIKRINILIFSWGSVQINSKTKKSETNITCQLYFALTG